LDGANVSRTIGVPGMPNDTARNKSAFVGKWPGFFEPAQGIKRKDELLTQVKARTAFRVYVERMNERPLIDSGCEKVLSLPGETQYAPNGIVSRTLLTTPNSRTVLFGFAAGQELTEHTSTQHALIQILSVACEFSLAGVPRSLKTGDLLYMPPNLPHAVKATEQFSMLLTLFRPARTPDPAP
jgi:quercetin dioxygenase-like cupin family protein